MRIPNGDRAVADLEKLTEYCLSPDHPRGKHKAQVFASALGLTQEHADFLRDALLRAAQAEEAQFGEKDDYGQRFVIDFDLEGRSGQARVRSTWIVRTAEDFPRLTSSYVL